MNQPNLANLPPELLAKLEQWEANKPENKQIGLLTDIADMTQEMLGVLDSTAKGSEKQLHALGAVLTDAREQLVSLNKKESPETPDISKPIVAALTKLETAISKELAKIDVKPEFRPEFNPTIEVAAPAVHVKDIDTKGIEKLLKTDIPKAFQQAIQSIPTPETREEIDYTGRFDELVEWLKSIDTASRLKPQPGTMKVTNPDGSSIGSLSGSTIYITVIREDSGDPQISYIGKAVPGSATSDAVWQIASLDENTNLDLLYADGGAFTQVYDNREALTYE